jgi:hypothetical protein
MGMHIERVPPTWRHPTAPDGRAKPGEHKRLLRDAEDKQCTAYQVYEDTSEGTPISPVFTERSALRDWLLQQGHSEGAVQNFLVIGAASSLFFREGAPVNGIEALAALSPEAAADIGAKHQTSIRRPSESQP